MMEASLGLIMPSSLATTKRSECDKIKHQLGESIVNEITKNDNCDDKVTHSHAPTNHDDVESEFEEDPPMDSYIDIALNRGALLRQWKLLALAEEEAANHYEEEKKEEEPMNENALCSPNEEEEYTIICKNTATNDEKGNKKKVLRYEQYLKHQRYHDDYKHVNCDYIDFGFVTDQNRQVDSHDVPIIPVEQQLKQRLVMKQDRQLGKGGLIWDAAFCLGEHLLHRKRNESWHRKTILELGAGTGMLGCWLGKALYDQNCHIMITDLPSLLDIMQQNVQLNNFKTSPTLSHPMLVDETIRDVQMQLGIPTNVENPATTIVEPRVLTWGKKEEYPTTKNCYRVDDDSFVEQHSDDCGCVDIIVGADIVTTLYDPQALAQTLWDLSTSDQTRIYLSGKSRMDQPHLEFEESAKKLFHHFEKISCTASRNTADVFVIEMWGRKDEQDVKDELLKKSLESNYHK